MTDQTIFTIRPADYADNVNIRALIRETGINPMGIHWQRFLVAEDFQGVFIGCGQMKHHRDGSIELASIAVIRTWRNHGVASEIIISLLASHPRPVYLTCRENLGVFYTKFGFRIIQLSEMTPYFRRISRLAAALRKIGLIPVNLLVMKLD